LKREGSEANLCRQIFSDKALAFPDLGFRFVQDGGLKVFLPPVPSRKDRFAAVALGREEGSFLHEINASGPGFSLRVVVGGPELYRNDRRQQYVFANGRRIQEFSLLQALEYGVQGWFPNGVHPVGAVYVDIDPALADFNIHPAKREVRFADPGAIHHAVTQSLRDFSRRRNLYALGRAGEEEPGLGGFDALGGEVRERPPGGGGGFYGEGPGGGFFPERAGSGGGGFGGSGAAALALEALLARPPDFAPLPGRGGGQAGPGEGPVSGDGAANAGGLRYVGRVFELFIIVEKEERLFIIDQHAAHERILYDRFIAGPVPRQELLVPIPFEAESPGDDRFLNTRREDLAKLGVLIEAGDGAWRIEALPVNWRLSDGETVKEILALKNAGEDMAERWAATLSCHGAVKDGAYLDESAALALAESALALPVPRCPHGRPLWFELRREDLYRAVRRT
jgi:DNA mismatch repair protein MutL